MERISTANRMAGGASGASSDTAGIVNSVAAAAEELSYSVREIAKDMSHASEGVQSIFGYAENAGAATRTLNDSANAMNNIVGLIQNIASQINLLALNATIESARAGEAGRGFAVVASEVKNLANQAASSTRTISDEIARMQDVSSRVTEAVEIITSNMTNVLTSVTSATTAIEQQSQVTGEISVNMQAAVTSVSEIARSLDEISQTFGEVSTATDQVKQSVEELAA